MTLPLPNQWTRDLDIKAATSKSIASQVINSLKQTQRPVAGSVDPLSAWNCGILPIAEWGPPAYID
jgi:hypothetical protein